MVSDAKSFGAAATKIWHILPDSIRSIDSLFLFQEEPEEIFSSVMFLPSA